MATNKATIAGLMTLILAPISVVDADPASDKSADLVTAKAVEATYPDLINQMTKMAKRGGTWFSSEAELCEKAVSPEEILQAKVGRNHGYTMIGQKQFEWEEMWFFLPRTPKVGHPVINRYWVKFASGRRLTIVSYEARVLDQDGKEWELLISFNPTALEKRLQDSREKDKKAGPAKKG
jgi:hypothetical protein